MWISTKAWLAHQEALLQFAADVRAAREQVKSQEITLGWFMHRLTQVEAERAKMIFSFTGVKVEAPTYEKEEIQSGINNPLNALPNFNDVGDKAAAELGIDWNKEGELIFGVTK